MPQLMLSAGCRLWRGSFWWQRGVPGKRQWL